MSDITQGSASKAPDVDIITRRADSLPNPESYFATATKCVTRAPWIVLRAVARFSVAAVRNGQARVLRIPIPTITFEPAPEVTTPVEVAFDEAVRSEASSVLTDLPVEDDGSTVQREGQTPVYVPERASAKPVRACKHCRFLASQPPIVVCVSGCFMYMRPHIANQNSVSACMDGQQAGEDSKKKMGFMTPVRDVQSGLQSALFNVPFF